MTTATATRQTVRRDLVRLAHRGLELDDFAHAAITLLRRAIPGEGTCLLTLDPATLLPTGEVVDGGLPPEAMPRMTEIELQEPDFNKFASLARRPFPAASPCFASRAARTSRPRRLRFAASLTGVLAGGVRRAMLTERGDGDADTDIGLLVLAPDGTIELRDRNAERWLGLLATDVDLPSVVRGVAARARRGGQAGPAQARVRTTDKQWMLVHGSLLGGTDARVAIHLEPARPAHLAPMIVAAYGLTDACAMIVAAYGSPTENGPSPN